MVYNKNSSIKPVQITKNNISVKKVVAQISRVISCNQVEKLVKIPPLNDYPEYKHFG